MLSWTLSCVSTLVLYFAFVNLVMNGPTDSQSIESEPCGFVADIMDFVTDNPDIALAFGDMLFDELVPIMVCIAGYHKYDDQYFRMFPNSHIGSDANDILPFSLRTAYCGGDFQNVCTENTSGDEEKFSKVHCMLCELLTGKLPFYRSLCAPKYVRNVTCVLEPGDFNLTVYDPIHRDHLINMYSESASSYEILAQLEKVATNSPKPYQCFFPHYSPPEVPPEYVALDKLLRESAQRKGRMAYNDGHRALISPYLLAGAVLVAVGGLIILGRLTYKLLFGGNRDD